MPLKRLEAAIGVCHVSKLKRAAYFVQVKVRLGYLHQRFHMRLGCEFFIIASKSCRLRHWA
jgi:hypothetical protein